MAKSSKTKLIRLVSSFGTGDFYTTTKTQNVEGKMSLKKYDRVVRKHGLFKEEKIK